MKGNSVSTTSDVQAEIGGGVRVGGGGVLAVQTVYVVGCPAEAVAFLLGGVDGHGGRLGGRFRLVEQERARAKRAMVTITGGPRKSGQQRDMMAESVASGNEGGGGTCEVSKPGNLSFRRDVKHRSPAGTGGTMARAGTFKPVGTGRALRLGNAGHPRPPRAGP